MYFPSLVLPQLRKICVSVTVIVQTPMVEDLNDVRTVEVFLVKVLECRVRVHTAGESVSSIEARVPAHSNRPWRICILGPRRWKVFPRSLL